MLTLISGPIGSGKTYLAERMASASTSLHLNLDLAMLTLYEPIEGREAFVAKEARCRQYLLELTRRSLRQGIPVILDWGFWREQDRLQIWEDFQPGVRLIALQVPVELRWQRVLQRQSLNPGDIHYFNRQTFDELDALYEVPSPAEIQKLGIEILASLPQKSRD